MVRMLQKPSKKLFDNKEILDESAPMVPSKIMGSAWKGYGEYLVEKAKWPELVLAF